MPASGPAPRPGSDRRAGGLQRILAAATSWIDATFAAVAITLLGFVVCANGLEIVQRGLFDTSFQWLYEINLLCSNWIYFLGMELVYYRKKDITLDFILMLMHGRARAIYVIAINLIGVATFAAVMFFALQLMALQWPFRSTGIGLPNALFTAPVVLACASFIVILVQQSVDLWVTGTLPNTANAVPMPIE